MQGELNGHKLYPGFGDKPLQDDAAARKTVKQITSTLDAHPLK